MYASSSAAYPIDLQQVQSWLVWSGLLPSASTAYNMPSAMRSHHSRTPCVRTRVRVRARACLPACGVSVCARVCVRACVRACLSALMCVRARARVCRFLCVDVSMCSHGARVRVCDRFTRSMPHCTASADSATQ